MGVDYNKFYIEAAKKRFENFPNVEIKEMNFYDIENEIKRKFDVVVFSSSFMILPRPYDALKIAQRVLNKGGKIYFLMTLFENKGYFEKIIELVKPYLKYVSSVDFGRITYESEFEKLIVDSGLKILEKWRCTGSIFQKIFKIYMVET